MTRSNLRCLFVGGPGRSGTSFVARRLGAHPGIVSFPDIELKLLTEKNGLLDLHHSLVETYTPNRATVASQQFRRMADALFRGQFGQPALAEFVAEDAWQAAIDRVLGECRETGHPGPQSNREFLQHARTFLGRLMDFAVENREAGNAPDLFLEKTPHALLNFEFLESLAPGSAYLHIMRDPRAIAFSLRRMRWGPDDLAACCAWVESYCRAYRSAARHLGSRGLDLFELRIEDITEDPERASERLTAWLGVAPMIDLFAGSSKDVLNGWLDGIADEEVCFLSTRLTDLAVKFGFDPRVIGQITRREVTQSPTARGVSELASGQ